MSGPKVITYTMSAFNGKLKELMSAQAKLKQIAMILNKSCISDEELNVHFDCKPEITKLMAQIEKALVQQVFDYKGSFEQKTYDQIDKAILKKMDEVGTLQKKCDSLLDDFNSRQKDYDCYKDYLGFFLNSEKSLNKFRQDFAKEMEKHFKAEQPEKTNRAIHDSEKVAFGLAKTEFNWGFAKTTDKEKEAVTDYIIGQENKIREIRSTLIDNILGSGISQSVQTDMFLLNPVISDEVKKVSRKIEMLVNNCNNQEIAEKYRENLSKLKQSESMNDIFYFKELHDRIFESEKTRNYKQEIGKMLAVMNGFTANQSVAGDKIFLQQQATNLLGDNKLTEKEFRDFKTSVESFYKRNKQAGEDEDLRQREQLFVKAQIIHNLENKGYEVMDDLQVIDFEKENDFYLKIPGQKNILNVKFKEDGSFRYVFQIPENKQSLSVDQQNTKLHEMKSTCSDFVEVLNDLKKMGLAIEVKSDKPVAIESMVNVPDKVKEIIEKSQTRESRRDQVKKLYIE